MPFALAAVGQVALQRLVVAVAVVQVDILLAGLMFQLP
jgi:hypothetical protein